MNKLKIALVIFSIVAIGSIDYMIYQKQLVKKSKDLVLLELQSSKMTAFLLGNHINLNYKISEHISKKFEQDELAALPSRGYIIVKANNKNVAEFIRFDNGSSLQENEKRIVYHRNNKYIQLIPDIFFLPAKHSEGYRQVKYAAFKFSYDNKPLLVGLADNNRKINN